MTQGWRMVKVFISSTFLDMQAERDHLVRFVFPRLREELLKRQVHLDDVDLRWGVTSEQNVLEVCREIIDECRPHFLCILGGRYGWVPPGRDHSITAEEVRYGVLDSLDRSTFASFYIRDAAVTAAMVEQKPGDFREPPGSDSATKLEALKRAIADRGLKVVTYSARWDAVHRRLTGLEDFGEQVHANLLRSIEEELGPAPEGAADPFADESASMDAFIEERTQQYVVGTRQPILDQLHRHADGEGEPPVLCVTGEAGSGKSALLARFCRDRLDPAAGRQGLEMLISHFVGASAASTDARLLLRRICLDVAQAVGDKDPLPEELEPLRERLSSLLLRAAPHRVLLVVDGVDQMDIPYQTAGLRWLPEGLPPNVRVILSMPPGALLDEFRRCQPPPAEIAVLPLSAADVNEIITRFLARYRKRLDDSQRAMLRAKADSGNPLYLLAALEELRTLGAYEQISNRIRELPETAEPLFLWILNRLEADPGFRREEDISLGPELVRRYVSCLAVSRRGLTESELTGILAPGDARCEPARPPDAHGHVAALTRLLRPYLMRRGELLDFYHSQYRQVVFERYVSVDQQRASRSAIIEFFASRRKVEPRKITELPWQLRETGQWRRLVELFVNPLFFIMAWNIDAYEVKNYWMGIEQNSPIRAVDAYQRIIESPPPMDEYIFRLAKFFLERGNSQAALALEDYLLKRSEVPHWMRGLGRIVPPVELGREDRLAQARVLGNKAMALMKAGRVEEAIALCRQEEQVFRELDDQQSLARSLGNQVVALHELGRRDEAETLDRESEALFRELKMHLNLGICLLNRVQSAWEEDRAGMLEMCLEAEECFRKAGDRGRLQECLEARGKTLEAMKQYDAAYAFYMEQEQFCRAAGDLRGVVIFLGHQAQILTYWDRMDEAKAVRQQVQTLARRIGYSRHG